MTRACLAFLRKHTAQHCSTATGTLPTITSTATLRGCVTLTTASLCAHAARISRSRLDRHPTPFAAMWCLSPPCFSHAVRRSPSLRQPRPVHTDLLPQPYSAVYSESLAILLHPVVAWEMGTLPTYKSPARVGLPNEGGHGLRSKSDGRVNYGMMTQGRAAMLCVGER